MSLVTIQQQQQQAQAQVPAGTGREINHLLDALPYVDQEYNDPEMQKRVEKMIQKEMSTFKPKDYLKDFPDATINIADDSFLKVDMLRVEEGLPMDSIDKTRYGLQPPAENKQKDPIAWRHALNNAQSQFEGHGLRLLNLELMSRYGVNQWRTYIQGLDATKNALQLVLENYKEQCEDVNRKRKADQTKVAQKLQNLEQKFWETAWQNTQLSQATDALDREVKKLRTEAVSKGLVKEEACNNGGPTPMETD
eukprot:GFYU01003909.1.p1 GENE.GFYU01003909.1~~GFYU01003909.1.p1  ORF type:complete len:251 (-),score=55.56 GFYU01003909.1:146-898(-)